MGPHRRSPFAKSHYHCFQRFCLQVAVHDDRILRVEVEDSFCQLKAPGSPGDALKRSQELVDLGSVRLVHIGAVEQPWPMKLISRATAATFTRI